MLRLNNYSSQTILKLSVFIFSTIFLSACNQQASPEKTTVWPTIENCDLNFQTCTSTQNNQSIRLKISPDPIPIAIPLGVELTVQNIPAEKIEFDISGDNMYMGYNRVTLIADGDSGRYVGGTMLAFCTTAKMKWKVTVIIHQKDGKQIQIPYLLETTETEMH
ncbi:hypothetical protein MNBD_GAMMA04-2049 [hydrothermal vent metagenome]|uniref:Lipoprotein n=1 Tax=hydrothermal vent metagenome TaxID=652676 RepID=A0A3B0VZ57_9ZZZZ